MSPIDRMHGSRPRPRRDARRARRREAGSVVTYVVTGFMIVALAIYLAVAFFGDDSGPAAAGDPAAAATERP